MKNPKYITINGIRFCRDDETGYYLNGTLNIRAHRYVYELANGPIPDGFHVHHKDENKANNSPDNLELKTHSDHATHHGLIRASDPEWLAWSRKNLAERARPKASEWHGSEEGLAWHRDHAATSLHAAPPRKYTCGSCGAIFEAKPYGANKFCSNACKSAARRASGTDDVTRKCEACGDDFTVNRYSKTRTCGRSCGNRLRSREKREALGNG